MSAFAGTVVLPHFKSLHYYTLDIQLLVVFSSDRYLGTIGGVIAMPDWLTTFGVYDPTPANTTGFVYYLPTAHKSLVVRVNPFRGNFFGALLAFPMADMSDEIGASSLLVVSSALEACLMFDSYVPVRVRTEKLAWNDCRTLSTCDYYRSIACCDRPQFHKKSLSHTAWRTPIAVQFAWAGILSGGLLLLPESPRFLMHKGREDEARRALARLMTMPIESPEVELELDEIVTALAADRAIAQGSYLDCFKNNASKNGLRTWTGIWLQGWQQLTGINFIFYYGTTFFKQAGISNPFIITIIADVVNTVMTIVGVQLIDRVGRRRLLLIGAIGMCLSEYIVAIVGVTVGQTNTTIVNGVSNSAAVNITAQRVLIAFVCIYIAFFAISWGPVVWVITGEIFPLNIRAKAMSLSVASNWLWNFGIGYATPYLVDPTTTGINGVKTAHLGVKVFFIWGSTCVGCFLFTYFFVPEVKGLSLEQIDLLYRESSIRNSDSYRRQMLEDGETYVQKKKHDVYVEEKERV
ncbi:hypothetical protein EV702DRAFT_1194655 [Suillus placidus]|uniref:Major facilitator superfamily (MFS) profile domain-containing protein n=1 Tax=Suillus placidus TaxID=48579 RepID=A0A9P7A182_9AGAM|nr:hypothetical protein EV702DRAFT_1194655 [Suillus placidus]